MRVPLLFIIHGIDQAEVVAGPKVGVGKEVGTFSSFGLSSQ